MSEVQITVSQETYKRLQHLAVPFEDTPEKVIVRLLDAYTQSEQKFTEESNIRKFRAASPPDLKHTKILFAGIGNERATGWNELVRRVHKVAWQSGVSKEELQQISPSSIIEGVYEKSGFHYFPPIDLSIQNVDANTAWANAYQLAKR